MRKITLIAVALLTALFLASCASYTPSMPASGPIIPINAMKIKKMTSVSYEYESANIGCSEIEFLKKFVGKKIRLDDGNVVFVDNILDIHTNVYSVKKMRGADNNYHCGFWGLAVEYEK